MPVIVVVVAVILDALSEIETAVLAVLLVLVLAAYAVHRSCVLQHVCIALYCGTRGGVQCSEFAGVHSSVSASLCTPRGVVFPVHELGL